MLRSGDVIAGRYRLTEPIASGGMGTVWLARHTELQVDIALKVILPRFADTAIARKRFQGEAQAAALLKSPHVVQVHDFGIFDGQPFLAMELLTGETLAERLERQGLLDLEATAGILEQVAKAIDFAHSRGIIHRDLKPANIFLAEVADEEIVKLLDFGIAKMEHNPDAAVTNEGDTVGSPAYMSPEQVWGEPVDKSSDLWSLAVVTFEMLTGQNPFEDSPLAKVFQRIVSDDLPSVDKFRLGLPQEVSEFFSRALVRSPTARFESARAMAQAMRKAASAPPAARGDDASAQTVPVSSEERPRRPVVDSGASGTTDRAPETELALQPPPPVRWIWLGGLLALLAGGLFFAVRQGPGAAGLEPARSGAATAASSSAEVAGSSASVPSEPAAATEPAPSGSARAGAPGESSGAPLAPTVGRVRSSMPPAAGTGSAMPAATATAEPTARPTATVDPRFGIPTTQPQ